jgi:RND family efflux transporter MFP subunit
MLPTRERRIGIGGLLAGVALALVGMLAAGCGQQQTAHGAQLPTSAPAAFSTGTSQPTTVSSAVVTVRRDALRRYAPAVGTLRARQTSRLGPQVAGRIAAVLVDVGDRVTSGQILARIDPVFFELDIQQATAVVTSSRGALASAEADVVEKEREMKRQLELFERGNGSPKDRDDAVTAYQRCVGTRDERAGRLAEAENRLSYCRQKLAETQIRAPFDGAVTARLVDPGEAASNMPPTPLLEVQEVGTLYLEFSLPQELLGVVRTGTSLEFSVEGGPEDKVTATVAVVFPAIDEATRSFRSRAIIDNRAGTFSPGLLAEVRVVAQEVPDALVLPRTAVTRTSAGWQVLIPAAGRSVPKTIAVGLVADDRVQVLSGLNAGDEVLAGAGN